MTDKFSITNVGRKYVEGTCKVGVEVIVGFDVVLEVN